MPRILLSIRYFPLDATGRIGRPGHSSGTSCSLVIRSCACSHCPCDCLAMALMTKQALRQICKDHKLYVTPHLNDKLYCNFKGFGSIGELEEYVNLKALFLEGNAIDSLEGLPPLSQLKCL